MLCLKEECTHAEEGGVCPFPVAGTRAEMEQRGTAPSSPTVVDVAGEAHCLGRVISSSSCNSGILGGEKGMAIGHPQPPASVARCRCPELSERRCLGPPRFVGSE
ncbi:hypothetical protein MRX96_056375 [Rhipicephalus microplus]